MLVLASAATAGVFAPENLRLDPNAPLTSSSAQLIWDAQSYVTILVLKDGVQVATVKPEQFRNLGRWWWPAAGLQPSTTYTFHVQAQSPAGQLSPLSDPLTFTTLPPENPVAENLRLDPTFPQTPFSVRLTWDAPSTSDVLVFRGDSTTPETVIAFNDDLEPPWQYTLQNLEQNTTYSFRVQAVSHADGSRGPISAPFTFTTLRSNDQTPPTATGNPIFTCDFHTISATWTATEPGTARSPRTPGSCRPPAALSRNGRAVLRTLWSGGL